MTSKASCSDIAILAAVVEDVGGPQPPSTPFDPSAGLRAQDRPLPKRERGEDRCYKSCKECYSGYRTLRIQLLKAVRQSDKIGINLVI